MAREVQAFIPEEQTIWIGDQQVKVKEVPLPRLKKFQPVWRQAVERYTIIRGSIEQARENGEEFTADSVFEEIANFVLEIPYDLLSVLIPNLPKEPFEYEGDEDKGVTFRQIKAAFEVIIEVNDLGWLKKQLPFFRDLVQTISLDPTN